MFEFALEILQTPAGAVGYLIGCMLFAFVLWFTLERPRDNEERTIALVMVLFGPVILAAVVPITVVLVGLTYGITLGYVDYVGITPKTGRAYRRIKAWLSRKFTRGKEIG